MTAIASGASSTGLVFEYTDATATVSAKSVIAEGAQDIKAFAIDAGASTTVELENSDYDSVIVDGPLGASSPTVTPTGTNGNIEAPPLLAADGFHELPGSPTVDAGLLDSESGITDIDGQPRTLDEAADIGADELASSSATGVSCSPDSLTQSGAASSCTATVTDPSARGTKTARHGVVPGERSRRVQLWSRLHRAGKPHRPGELPGDLCAAGGLRPARDPRLLRRRSRSRTESGNDLCVCALARTRTESGNDLCVCAFARTRTASRSACDHAAKDAEAEGRQPSCEVPL